jgi:hypothetical protein
MNASPAVPPALLFDEPSELPPPDPDEVRATAFELLPPELLLLVLLLADLAMFDVSRDAL